ncbi:MAG: hypothetical protein ACXW32_04965 [Limisphaerales bacterium]
MANGSFVPGGTLFSAAPRRTDKSVGYFLSPSGLGLRATTVAQS